MSTISLARCMAFNTDSSRQPLWEVSYPQEFYNSFIWHAISLGMCAWVNKRALPYNRTVFWRLMKSENKSVAHTSLFR